MKVTHEIETPVIALVHFKNEEMIEAAGGRIIYYQVTLYPSGEATQLSPSGEFIRFGDVAGDEITGWQPASNIVMDEVLFEYEGMEAVPFNNKVEVKGHAPDTITVEDVVNG